MTKPTKANAKRWLDAQEGQLILTRQVYPSGRTPWEPGLRTLTKKGGSHWWFDRTSHVDIRGESTRVVSITEDDLVLDFIDTRTGDVIHTTTYTVAQPKLV